MNKRHRVRKVLLIVLTSLLVLVVLVIAFISPLTRYLIEKYDKKYTGRQITLDWAYVNPFTGYIHFDDLKVYEAQSDSVFVSCAGISVSLDLMKMLHKEYTVKGLTLSSPRVTVIQRTKDEFNFSDLVEKFAGDTTKPKTDTVPVHFNLLRLKIKDGTFVMREEMTPVNYAIKNLDITSSGLRWDVDTVSTRFSFDNGVGSGNVKGAMTISKASSDYTAAIDIRKLDLTIIEQYMRDMANYGSFRAIIDASVKAKGNFKQARKLDANGYTTISDFHFGKSKNEDFVSFDKFHLAIRRLNPEGKKYIFDSVSLVKPFARYEKYNQLDNIQNMFGKNGENVKNTAANPEKFNLVIELARYVKLLSRNFLNSDYKINRLGIYNANLQYADYSLNEKFSMAVNPLTIVADSIFSNKKAVRFALRSGIRPYGDLAVNLSINPKDSSDFVLDYNLEKVNAAVLNPYLITLTSFPIDRGSISFKGNWQVRDGAINSNNHLLVIDPRVSKRIKSNRNKWLPLKVAMFFVRERGNVVDYEIPITGNLKDPTFHIRDVLFDILTNVFVKPATTPYRYEIKTLENKIEKNLMFTWTLRSAVIQHEEEKFLDRIADFLKKYPEASIVVSPVVYADKEKEYIAFYEAKKKYFRTHMKTGEFTGEDSTRVEKMGVKDPLFAEFLKKRAGDTLMFTAQQRCKVYLGASVIESHYKRLLKAREQNFITFFKEKELADRIKIKQAVNKVPFNGFSFYAITYNGEVPPALKEAFDELNAFDTQTPRDRVLEERKKTRRFKEQQVFK